MEEVYVFGAVLLGSINVVRSEVRPPPPLPQLVREKSKGCVLSEGRRIWGMEHAGQGQMREFFHNKGCYALPDHIEQDMSDAPSRGVTKELLGLVLSSKRLLEGYHWQIDSDVCNWKVNVQHASTSRVGGQLTVLGSSAKCSLKRTVQE